jgi:hypothetical protein
MTITQPSSLPLAASGKPRLTLVLLNPVPGAEWDWVRRLLSRYELEVVTDPAGEVLKPGALYHYYGDKKIHLPDGFLDKVARLEGCGFLHCGDEYFRADMRAYAAFAYVIRAPWTDLLRGPGVMGVPIGPSNDMPDRPSTPASRRGLVWSFAGGRRLSRVAMARELAGLAPNLVSLPDLARGEKHISRSSYLDALADSVFIPCVEGNVILETLRPYEALSYGAIPILPKRPFADTFRSILGLDHPLPTFLTWGEARAFMVRMMADKPALDALQTRVTGWWTTYCEDLSGRIESFIESGRRGEMREALRQRFANFTGPGWQAGRFWELTRQQGGGQIRERLEKLPAKMLGRLQGKSTAGVWSLGDPPGNKNVDKELDKTRTG